MAKPRKKKGGAPAAPKQAAPPETAADETLWPADFPSGRSLAVAAFLLLALGVVLVRAADANALLWMKRLVGYMAGMPDPMRLPYDATSWDIAVVCWCLVAGITASVFHPAFGLAAIVLLRPWLDAMTFPTENTFFTWLILLLAVLCCVRMLTRGEPLRAVSLSALLTAFLAVCLATTFTSIQFQASFDALIAWFSHLLVFLIVVNSIRSAAARRVLLAAFVAVAALEALYAIVSYFYLLPVLRSIARNPAVLREFFGTNELTPEIAARLNRNRAFGSMLFPNALAAFLVLALPYMLATIVPAWRALRKAKSERPPRVAPSQKRIYLAIGLFLGIWAGAGGWLFYLSSFPVAYHEMLGSRAWYSITGVPAILSAGLGLILALWVAYQVARYGPAHAAALVRGYGLPVAAFLSVVALVLTYSRGAMLALAVALVVTWLLYRGRLPVRASQATAAVAMVVLVGLLVGSLLGLPAVADADGATSTPALVESGESVTSRDLLNPHTLMLRFAYWGAGLRMFLDHPVTGLGLRCYGTAYAAYQEPGGPPVREAHTSLQVFPDTGLFGGVLFYAFWVTFFVWGARRVLCEEDAARRLVLAGLLGSALAFFLHAGLDISFSHDGLCFMAFLMTGLFVSHALTRDGETEESTKARKSHLAAVVALLGVTIVAFGVSARAMSQDIALSRGALYRIEDKATAEISQRLSTMNFYVRVRQKVADKTTPSQVLLRHALDLGIPMDKAAKEGVLYAPIDGGARGARRLRPGEAAPPDAVLDVRRPLPAYRHAMVAAGGWLADLERIDARFPHSVDLAISITQGYMIPAGTMVETDIEEKRRAYFDKSLAWAEESVRRSPMASDLYDQLSRVWRLKAQVQPDQRIEAWEKATEAAQQAADLAPAHAPAYGGLAHCHEKLATFYTAEGNAAKAEEHAAKAEAAQARADSIWRAGEPAS